ncbi:MAG: glycosyltransferase family 4 protein, partial [Anaerolineae bacterium]|nr:glycosyltransferase family 4 protein [Anaerolineae bacterium]
MRILLLTTSYPLSLQDGTAPVIRSIATSLMGLGHEVHVLAPERTGAPQQTSEGGVTVDWVRYAPHRALRVIGHAQSLQDDVAVKGAAYAALPLYLAATLAHARTLCKTWQPDVIHAHWAIPGGVLGALIARFAHAQRVPLVISLHGSDMYLALKSPLYGRVARWAFDRATAISACSKNLFDAAIKIGAPLNKTRVVLHGVDTERFSPAPAQDDKTQVVLAVGRLVAKKGFDQLIAAAPEIFARCPAAEIWIGGEGDSRAQLESSRAALPAPVQAKIKFLGQCPWDELPALLRQAAVFALPSVRDEAGNEDGLPNILLEALASGLPVVASDLAGIPSVVQDEVTGLLVPPGDAPGASCGHRAPVARCGPARQARRCRTPLRRGRTELAHG